MKKIIIILLLITSSIVSLAQLTSQYQYKQIGISSNNYFGNKYDFKHTFISTQLEYHIDENGYVFGGLGLMPKYNNRYSLNNYNNSLNNYNKYLLNNYNNVKTNTFLKTGIGFNFKYRNIINIFEFGVIYDKKFTSLLQFKLIYKIK